jgi:Ca-activated chloride channel family protein
MIPPSIPPAQPSRRTLGSLLGMEPPQDDPESGGGAALDGDRRPMSEPARLPLARVSATVRIVGDCAETELEEHYTNTHGRPLDVTHTIPLPPGAAVTGVEIRAAGRTVRGACLRTPEARERHSSAKRRGKTSALVEQRRDDIHTIMLANVPAGASIAITLRIVERLRVADGRFEYRLPTGISPKFVPGSAVGHDGDGWSPDTTRAPDASHLTPPVLAGEGTPMDVDVLLAAGATDVRSSIALERADEADGSIRLRPASPVACGNDIVIRFWGRDTTPTLRAYSDGARTLVVVDPPLARHPDRERPREVVYVLDRSGSMASTRIGAAKRAIIASLRALSPRDRIQIMAFSDGCAKFRPRPTLASVDTIEAAIRWVGHIEAQGGTNALEALAIACTTPVAAKRVRTVLLLTDGNVANDAEILQMTRRMDPATRLFAIGIGTGPSHALLSRLARLGGGTYTAVSSHDAIEAEVLAFDHATVGPIAFGLHEADADEVPDAARTPKAHAARVESAGSASAGASLPATVHDDLFAGRATSFFLTGHRDRVRIASLDGHFSAECAVHSSPMALGALWARDEVERLEDQRVAEPELESELDAQIADLGVTHQIQTRLTSFVAVDEASQVIGDSLSLVQPTAAPDDSMMVRASMARYCSVDTMDDMIFNAPPTSRLGQPKYCHAPEPDEYRLHRAGSWLGGGLMPARRRTRHKLPVIRLLGGTHGLPRGFGSRKAWVRCGLELLVDAQDAAALREISRKIGFPRQIAPEAPDAETMTLPYAIVAMIMAIAWESIDWRDHADGEQPTAGSLEPPPEQWFPVSEALKAHATQPGLAEFVMAAEVSDIPAMIRAAVRAAVATAARG